MKSQMSIVASLCVAIALAVVPAYAQRGGVQAKVPFNFAVSGKTFPAGQYTMIAVSHQVTTSASRPAAGNAASPSVTSRNCVSCWLISAATLSNHMARTATASGSAPRTPG